MRTKHVLLALMAAFWLTPFRAFAAPMRYYWSGRIVSVGPTFASSFPVGMARSGDFEYDPDGPLYKSAGHGWIFEIRNNVYNHSASRQVDGIYESYVDSDRYPSWGSNLELLATNLTVFPGPGLPRALPPLSKFDFRRRFKYGIAPMDEGYEVEITNLVASVETPIGELRIEGMTRTGTNLQLNFTAPRTATVFLEHRSANAVWSEVKSVGGYNGFIIASLPTNGFGIFRLRLVGP